MWVRRVGSAVFVLVLVLVVVVAVAVASARAREGTWSRGSNSPASTSAGQVRLLVRVSGGNPPSSGQQAEGRAPEPLAGPLSRARASGLALLRPMSGGAVRKRCFGREHIVSRERCLTPGALAPPAASMPPECWLGPSTACSWSLSRCSPSLPKVHHAGWCTTRFHPPPRAAQEGHRIGTRPPPGPGTSSCGTPAKKTAVAIVHVVPGTLWRMCSGHDLQAWNRTETSLPAARWSPMRPHHRHRHRRRFWFSVQLSPPPLF